MKLLITSLTLLVGLSNAAHILPVDTSVVNVKSEHSGKDYSYSIHENRGFAIDPSAIVPHPLPTVRLIPGGTPEAHLGLAQQEQGKKIESHVTHHQVVTKTAPQELAMTNLVPAINYHYLNLPYPYAYTFPYGYAYPYNVVLAA